MKDMLKEKNHNSRISFLKKISLGFVSVLGLSLSGIIFQKTPSGSGNNIKTISQKEAAILIKNMPSPKQRQLKPEPPPDCI